MAEHMSLEQKIASFWSKVNRNGPVPPLHPEMSNCWIWEGADSGDGYGMFATHSDGVTNRKAHRFAYFLCMGYWPEPVGDHLCHVRMCVRPDHIRAATQRENTNNRAVQICKRGHPLADPNLYHYKSKGFPKRRCLTCHRANQASLKAKYAAQKNTH